MRSKLRSPLGDIVPAPTIPTGLHEFDEPDVFGTGRESN